MSAPEHLWPARPEYLRRGTPVMLRRTRRWEGHVWRFDLIPLRDQVQMDLRDVTARAHAAMAWTVVTDDLPLVLVRVTGDDRDRGHDDDDARRIIETLHRMRMMDETVTVGEAREALGWAERVAGVAL